jgi:hypothetical protein
MTGMKPTPLGGLKLQSARYLRNLSGATSLRDWSKLLGYTGFHGSLVCYYESIKRGLKRRLICWYRWDERLNTKNEESTRLSDTGLVVELEHLKKDKDEVCLFSRLKDGSGRTRKKKKQLKKAKNVRAGGGRDCTIENGDYVHSGCSGCIQRLARARTLLLTQRLAHARTLLLMLLLLYHLIGAWLPPAWGCS